MKTPLALRQRSVIPVVLLLAACSSDGNTGTPANGGAAQAGGGGAATGGAGNANGGAGATSAAGQAGNVAKGGNMAGAAGSAAGAGGATAGAGGAAAGSAGVGGANVGGAGGNAPFELVSSAFKEGAQIPLKYKCDKVNPQGENISPPLSWGAGPPGTKSYAVVLHHVPTPEHWVIWDIPAVVTSLPENIEHQSKPAMPAGAKQSYVAGLDGFTGPGYLGPCPQAFNSPQTYVFTLYALDVETLPGPTESSSPGEAANIVKQHLVAGSKGVTLSGTQVRMN